MGRPVDSFSSSRLHFRFIPTLQAFSDFIREVPGPPRKPFFGIGQFLLDNQDRPPTVLLVSFPTNSIALIEEGQYPFVGCTRGALFCLVDEVCVDHILQGHLPNYVKGELFRKLFGDLFGKKKFNFHYRWERRESSSQTNVQCVHP